MNDSPSIGAARTWRGAMTIKPSALEYAQLSFSLRGEDIAIAQHFKWQIAENKTGFFVDIGCAWPIQISNTYLFSCLGWSGVGIDMNQFHREGWQRTRPRDIFVEAAVGDSDSNVNVFAPNENVGQL